MWKPFEKNGQKDLQKHAIFSKSSKHLIIIELALGKSYYDSFSLFSECEILSLFWFSL